MPRHSGNTPKNTSKPQVSKGNSKGTRQGGAGGGTKKAGR